MMKSMTVVKIETQPRSYEAVIESGLLARAGEQVREVAGGRQNVFVVTAPPVRRKWAKILTGSRLSGGISCSRHRVDAGRGTP
jgi:hypothetical protein